MDRILNILQAEKPITSEDIARTAASESRRERHRARLRIVHLARSDGSGDPEDNFAVMQGLRNVKSKLSGRDWSVMCHLAVGYNYAEVAAIIGGTPGSLRVRVQRCRQKIGAEAA